MIGARAQCQAVNRRLSPLGLRQIHVRTLVTRMQISPRDCFGMLAFLVLSGCAVERLYPESWAPPSVPTTEDCARFAGIYGDRGESPGSRNRPSLTLELLGSSSGWARATRVSFSLPRSSLLEVTVWQGTSRLFTRVFSSWAGHFACEKGRLIVRAGRLVSTAGGAGIERVTITFGTTEDHLVAEVKTVRPGVATIVPVAAAATAWYRFPRLSN